MSSPENAGSEFVPLVTRYHTAWDEIHTRVEARQTIRVQFAVVAVGSAAAVLSNVADPNDIAAWMLGLALALPLLSWAFVLWARHNDAVIGLLSLYCGACEAIGDTDNLRGLPGWNRDEQAWIVRARQFGRYSDVADMLLVLLATLPALWLLVGPTDQLHAMISVKLIVSVLVIAQFAAVAFIWRKRGLRLKIAKRWQFRLTPSGWRLVEEQDGIAKDSRPPRSLF